MFVFCKTFDFRMKNNIRGLECGLPFILFYTNDVVFEVSTTDWMLTTTVWISYFNFSLKNRSHLLLNTRTE